MTIKTYLRKKGITPLMATFLLISFAVAVGVTITNFGRAQVEEEAECALDINLKLAVIGGREQLCYSTEKKQISFTVENGPNIKVEGLILNIIGTDAAETVELNDAKILKAGTYLGRMSYDTSNAGTPQQIKITPKILPYDEEQICTEKSLVVENIRNC